MRESPSSDESWSSFDGRVGMEGEMRVVALAPDVELTRELRDQLVERNLAALAAVAALEERRSDTAEEDSALHQEIARLDAKLNVLADLVNRLLAPASGLPARQPVRFNAMGAVVPAELLPAGLPDGSPMLLRLHLDACPSLPLELPAHCVRRLDDARLFLAFDPMPEAASDAIERLVFRHHRRKVAEARHLGD